MKEYSGIEGNEKVDALSNLTSEVLLQFVTYHPLLKNWVIELLVHAEEEIT